MVAQWCISLVWQVVLPLLTYVLPFASIAPISKHVFHLPIYHNNVAIIGLCVHHVLHAYCGLNSINSEVCHVTLTFAIVLFDCEITSHFTYDSCSISAPSSNTIIPMENKVNYVVNITSSSSFVIPCWKS